MNNDKVRELFSAYYEDQLEAGMRQVIGQRIESDPELRADYAAFDETMRGLAEMREEQIEVPSTLRDRIANRVESSVAKPRMGLAWPTWLRGLAFAGVASIALALIFVTSQRSPNDPNVSVGGLTSVPGAANADQLDFDLRNGEIVMTYHPSRPKSVVVSSGTTGVEIKRFNLNGKDLQSPLTNNQEGTALLAVEVSDESGRSLVAVPGTGRIALKTGNGTVVQLAVAVAGYYHVPVVVMASDESLPVAWNFGILDARQATAAALAGQTLSVDQKASGLLVIRSN